jgi:hypothetical protein
VDVDAKKHDITRLNIAVDGQATNLSCGTNVSSTVLYDGMTIPWPGKHFDSVRQFATNSAVRKSYMANHLDLPEAPRGVACPDEPLEGQPNNLSGLFARMRGLASSKTGTAEWQKVHSHHIIAFDALPQGISRTIRRAGEHMATAQVRLPQPGYLTGTMANAWFRYTA